jgi:hypothetical protein
MRRAALDEAGLDVISRTLQDAGQQIRFGAQLGVQDQQSLPSAWMEAWGALCMLQCLGFLRYSKFINIARLLVRGSRDGSRKEGVT